MAFEYGPFMLDLHMKDGDFPVRYVNFPEGMCPRNLHIYIYVFIYVYIYRHMNANVIHPNLIYILIILVLDTYMHVRAQKRPDTQQTL